MLPNLSALAASNIDTARKRGILDLVPRSVQLDNRCAKFKDGSSLRFRVDEYEDGRVTFEIGGSGEFGLEFYTRGAGTPNIVVNDTVGNTAWKTDGTTDKFLAKCLVAFSTFLKRRYPWLENASYSNNAIVDGIEKDDDYYDDEQRREAIQQSMWRVKYYESLGFEFEVKYADQVEDMLEMWNMDYVSPEEASEVTFKGNLVDIDDAITSKYPQCELVSLAPGLCK